MYRCGAEPKDELGDEHRLGQREDDSAKTRSHRYTPPVEILRELESMKFISQKPGPSRQVRRSDVMPSRVPRFTSCSMR